jgi:rubrerythrin
MVKLARGLVAQHLENVKTLEPLTDREVTRAIRDAIIAEEGAINQYETVADSTSNPKVKEVLQDIADEERVHVGELQTLLNMLLDDEQDLLDEGKSEVEDE